MPHAMNDSVLRIGRINYLNVWPLYHHLVRRFPPDSGVVYTAGHPSELNRLLAEGGLDLSPSSSFEYLRHGERYRLLPSLSISADGPVLSVHLVSPCPREELGEYLARTGSGVALTTASASSVALLKVLWNLAWKLPEPAWTSVEPGQGLHGHVPFLEIGDLALHNHVQPPKGWHIIDLAEEWKTFTGLPCVFAVWIVRRGLDSRQSRALARVHAALLEIKRDLDAQLPDLSRNPEHPAWLTPEAFMEYFTAVRYELGPSEQASLALFGDCCRRLGLIPGFPALSWAL